MCLSASKSAQHWGGQSESYSICLSASGSALWSDLVFVFQLEIVLEQHSPVGLGLGTCADAGVRVLVEFDVCRPIGSALRLAFGFDIDVSVGTGVGSELEPAVGARLGTRLGFGLATFVGIGGVVPVGFDVGEDRWPQSEKEPERESELDSMCLSTWHLTLQLHSGLVSMYQSERVSAQHLEQELKRAVSVLLYLSASESAHKSDSELERLRDQQSE